METPAFSRRTFTKSAATAATLTTLGAIHGQQAASNRLRVGIMALGRGRGHIKGWLEVPGVEIAWLCDVDASRHEEAARVVQRGGQEIPAKFTENFQDMLDDPEVDVISVATPNYWHTTAAILAMKAGKHVYVEKPGSHNAAEGEWLVAAARHYDRKVQMGNQRRSYPSMIEGIQQLHDGVIGKLRYGRAYYTNQRPSIGVGKPAEVPANLDYELWQGPVPEYPYKDNLVHYNWHWHWHFGGGEMANNGIHSLDIVRWGLQAETPTSVSYQGRRYHHDDDQETPDTGVATFEFGDEFGASWEHGSCNRRKPDTPPFVSFEGDGGFASCDGAGFKFYDMQGTEIGSVPGKGGDAPHFKNLADAIRADIPLNSEIAEGQKSTLWCHLANQSVRTGETLKIDPETNRPDSAEAMELWEREYRAGWKERISLD